MSQRAEAECEGLVKLRALRVDRTSSIPVYLQISEGIRSLLKSGDLPRGTRLPPSSEFCRQFDVSMMTMREAWDLLAREGLVESHRGKGTFVCAPRVEKSLTEMRGFTEEMLLRGKTPETRLLSLRCTHPGFAARDLFQLGEGEQVYQIRRLRLADGVPLAIEEVQIPFGFVPGLEKYIASHHSLYGILMQHYGLRMARCVDDVSAVLPTKEQRQLLSIDHPTALLMIRRTSYSSAGNAVELAVTLYRGDMYTATVNAVKAL